MRRLAHLAALTLPLLTGCCGDGERPRLFQRLFHHDEDCPSSRAASRPAAGKCEAQQVPLAAPTSYGAPVQLAPATTIPYEGGNLAQPRATRPDELPPPERIPAPASALGMPGGR